MSSEKEIIETIREKIGNLNILFEQAAFYNIKFDFNFAQDQSFGKGNVAHLTIKIYKEI